MDAAAGIRLIAFDVDGTLVAQTVYIWETLHRHFGSDPKRRKQAAEDFFAGRIDYPGWFANDIALLQENHADRAGMQDCLDGLSTAPGAHETLRELRQRGYRLAVISGSLDFVVEHFFAEAGFAHVLINRFEFDAEGRLCGGQPTPYDMAAKAEGLRELARREGLEMQDCAFVGDNRNDLHALRAAGFSVAVHAKHPSVVEAATVAMPGEDLRGLLDYFSGTAATD